MVWLSTTTGRPNRAATAVITEPQERSQPPQMQQGPWYAAILCRLTLHSGWWQYVVEGTCKQLKVCERCGATIGRTKHQRQWQYIRNGDCEQVKVCQRCKDPSGNRTRHIWGGEWESGNWWNRKRNHRCERCGEIETWSANSE